MSMPKLMALAALVLMASSGRQEGVGGLATPAGVLKPALISEAVRAAVEAPAIIPDPLLTPGAVRTIDIGEICSAGTTGLRHWSRDRDDRILREYGLPAGPHLQLEIDHLIPLGIGGSDDDRNLWSEPRRSLTLSFSNGDERWSAERKAALEWRLRDLECSRQIDVREAQQAIREDWTRAFRKYVGE
jgi:hypothetical protein